MQAPFARAGGGARMHVGRAGGPGARMGEKGLGPGICGRVSGGCADRGAVQMWGEAGEFGNVMVPELLHTGHQFRFEIPKFHILIIKLD